MAIAAAVQSNDEPGQGEEKISLYFSEGASDKEYHAQLVAQDGGYKVFFQYGRRGAALQSGSKTENPIPYDKAKKIYDRLVSEKTSKGYTTGATGAAFQSSDMEARVSGFLPQLLNAIEEADVDRYINDPDYIAQEKMDGDRRMTSKKGLVVDGINRKGLVVALPMSLVDPLLMASVDLVLDSEIIGDVLYVFDAVECGGLDMKSRRFESRFEVATEIVESIGRGNIRIVPLARTAAEKRALFNEVKARNGEGVVFKLKDAPYTPGRPASYGPQLKYKFVESASCLVEKVNEGKRSVALCMLDKNGKCVPVGNVTIPANYEVPKPGVIVEIRYLYAYLGGSLFQPVYCGERDDIEVTACTTSQLKYKPVA